MGFLLWIERGSAFSNFEATSIMSRPAGGRALEPIRADSRPNNHFFAGLVLIQRHAALADVAAGVEGHVAGDAP